MPWTHPIPPLANLNIPLPDMKIEHSITYAHVLFIKYHCE